MKTRRSNSLAFLFIISFNGLLINCEQAVNLNYGDLLEAQFLDLFDEVDVTKKNGQKLDTVYRETVSHIIYFIIVHSGRFIYFFPIRNDTFF